MIVRRAWIFGACLSLGSLLGATHSCALNSLGDVWCWEQNENGQPGVSPMGPAHAAPTKIEALNAVAIETGTRFGDHTCAITTTGEVGCWGEGSTGTLGDEVPLYLTPGSMVVMP